MKRADGRAADEIRPLRFKEDFLTHPVSSVLIEMGGTHVCCSLSVENKVPPWMKAQKVEGGWLTCEYGMLPGSSHERNRREAAGGKPNGRSMEIQRLIGRSLRNAVDLQKLGENTLYMDCDVLNADGGTRCAGITGAAAALEIAFRAEKSKKLFMPGAFKERIAAVSVGIVDGVPLLDLCYEEDVRAQVDMNVIMTAGGKLVEVQGTAEEKVFSRAELNELLDLAEYGLRKIFAAQEDLVEQYLADQGKGEVGDIGFK